MGQKVSFQAKAEKRVDIENIKLLQYNSFPFLHQVMAESPIEQRRYSIETFG